jgi:hypothetical protein
MILDKRSANDERRMTNDERRPAAKSLRRAGKQIGLRRRFVAQFSILKRPEGTRFSLPPRWLRLLLLTLAVGALSVIGATLGRGFSSGVAVVSQVVGPTSAAVATPVPQVASAPPLMATAAPIPVVAAAAAPAAPVPLATANVEQRWPLLAEEHFDGVSERWPEVRSSPSWSSSYQDGGYLMQVDSRPGISYSGPLRAHDFWYSADIRITRGQAGLFFLIGRPNDFYRLLIDTDGRYQLEWQQVGVSQPLIAWTASDALLRGAGQVNQIAVRRVGDLLTLYANGALLATYSLPAGNTLESRIGLSLDAPEGGSTGLAWFDNLIVRAPGTQ